MVRLVWMGDGMYVVRTLRLMLWRPISSSSHTEVLWCDSYIAGNDFCVVHRVYIVRTFFNMNCSLVSRLSQRFNVAWKKREGLVSTSIPRFNLLRGVACGRSNQWFLCRELPQDGGNWWLNWLFRWVPIIISQLYRFQFQYLSALLGGYFVQFAVVWDNIIFVCYRHGCCTA